MFGEAEGSTQHGTESLESTTAVRNCAEHGPYVAFLSARGGYTGCTQCADLDKGKGSAAGGELIENLMIMRSGVPEGIAGASFESFHPILAKQKSMLTFVVGIAEQWHSRNFEACGQLALFGNSGTGKTHIAVSMLRRIAESMEVRYVDASLGLPAVDEDSGLLVLDNLFYCDEPFDASKTARLNDLLYARTENKQPTIFISEQTKDQFNAKLSGRTLHWLRMARTQVVNFNWDVETHLVG